MNRTGDVQLAPTGTENKCCQFDDPPCPNNPGPYNVGDTIMFNTYWTETLDGTQGFWDVSWTLGVAIPHVVHLYRDVVISFGDLSGEHGEQTFCMSVPEVLTDEWSGLDVEVGHGVRTAGGQLATGPNGSSFSVNGPPGPTCWSCECNNGFVRRSSSLTCAYGAYSCLATCDERGGVRNPNGFQCPVTCD